MSRKLKRYLLRNKDVKRLWKATGKKDLWACTAAVMFKIPWFECTNNYNGVFQPNGKVIRTFVKELVCATVFSNSSFDSIPTVLDDWTKVRMIVRELREHYDVQW